MVNFNSLPQIQKGGKMEKRSLILLAITLRMTLRQRIEEEDIKKDDYLKMAEIEKHFGNFSLFTEELEKLYSDTNKTSNKELDFPILMDGKIFFPCAK